MGRHSSSYTAAHQRLSQPKTGADTARYVGYAGLLAIALGVGASVAGGTATANADTAGGNDADHHSAPPSPGSSAGSSTRKPGTDSIPSRTAPGHRAVTEGPASLPRSVSRIPRKIASTPAPDAPAEANEPSTSPRGLRPARETRPDRQTRPARERTAAVQAIPGPTESGGPSVAPTATTTLAPAVPSPEDQVSTEYGDIGKWMLEPSGRISDYGGQLDDGKTLLEPVNVIIVDPTSRTAWIATWKLNATMRKAGFPAQAVHSGGFRGVINGRTYRQQPTGFRGFSNNFFLLTNDHGRVFGPAPVKTSNGYVWSGAFSTEEWGSYNGRPAHLYVSSNDARDALATALLARGRATDGGLILLDNAYNTDATTTGDHDGNAVVVILE